MKTIIVATDFSAEAGNAARYAANFASETGAKIVLFHLYNMSVHALNSRLSGDAMDDFIKLSRKKHLEKANKLSEEYKIDVAVIWSTGDFQNELQSAITSTQADIVVMGMPGKSFEQDILGNTTTATIQNVKIPVLTVPSNATYQGLKTMLFACDIARGIHKTILERIKNIAAVIGATVEVFHVANKMNQMNAEHAGSEIIETLKDGLQGINYYHKNVESDRIIGEIQDEIKQISADLLIMIPHKYGFWASMSHISKTRIMASRSEIPLLSLHM